MTTLFRNVDVPSGAPPAAWPYEAIVATIERGLVQDWAVLTREIRRDPWGAVARQVADYLDDQRPPGVGPLLAGVIERSRAQTAESEKAEVAAEIDGLVRGSGLTSAAFAARIGTSASRLSTYRRGSVTPSAAVLLRMRRLVEQLRDEGLT
ncbi:helix-turn-helix domain-containing protein [Ornithinimicrobium murale]|uniref:helix-turn-helix domain-containing protein n=1 Tax=Ornithinimicrobium murale TaxID=1050153 RepID=UPI000E0D39C1|nr:helix-turn-helix transcriptional regulator [Ornithinimicrobium murale]